MLILTSGYHNTSLFTSFVDNIKGSGNMIVFWFLGTLILTYMIFVPIINNIYIRVIISFLY